MDPAVDVDGFSACALGEVRGDLCRERWSLERWDGDFDHVGELSRGAGGMLVRRHGSMLLSVYVIMSLV